MKKFFLGLVLAVLSCSANAQLLYKVSGNGLSEPSYIFGTHHLAPISILDSIQGFQAAFDASSCVVTEVSMTEMMSQESMQLMQKNAIIESDTTLRMLFTPEEFEMVNKFTKENLRLDLEKAPNFKPSFINNNVIVVVYLKHMKDFNPQEQLDMYIQVQGSEQGKTTASFETLEFQMNLLFNGASLQRQADLLVCALSDEEKLFTDQQLLTQKYMAQDLAGLYQLSLEKQGDHCDALPAEMEAMVDNRNKDWVQKLPNMMKQIPLFVAVGALHLPGENGVLNLLSQQGYTVEAVR